MKYLGNLLIVTDRYPHAYDAISSSFVKSQVDCIKEHFDKVFVISLTPYVPKFMTGLSFMNPRWGRDAYATDYEYDNVSVYYAKYPTLPVDLLRKRRGNVVLKIVNNILKCNKLAVDLIHAHFIYPSGYVGALLSKRLIKPLIITGHGYDVYDLPFKDSKWNKQVREILTAADHIITPSKSNCQMLMKLGTPIEKISVIPNGYSSTLFEKMPVGNARKKLNLPEDKTILLSVGNLESVKGHEYLIKSMKRFCDKDILCLIVGAGGLERKLNRLIDNLNLEKCVRLAGAKPHGEISLWMNACDVFALPSLSESFGIVQLEAMACGKPVVATRNGGSEEIIINEKLGILVEPKDVDELANGILEALATNWDADYISYYSEQFTWNKMADRIVDVYDEVFEK